MMMVVNRLNRIAGPSFFRPVGTRTGRHLPGFFQPIGGREWKKTLDVGVF
jgi:hypothetical protein